MPRISSPVSLADVRKTLPLAKRLAKAVDADKDQRVNREEVARVRIRDGYVARNMLSRAIIDGTYGHDDPDLSPASMSAMIERGMRSLERADKNGDGQLSATELRAVSKMGQALVAFAQEHQGKRVSDFDIKPFEKPGSKAWAALACAEYYDTRRLGGRPYFGTAMKYDLREYGGASSPGGGDRFIGRLPEAVARRIPEFRERFPTGDLEASSWLVNGAAAFYVHVKEERVVHVLALDGKGKVLGEGTAKPRFADANKDWRVSWNDG